MYLETSRAADFNVTPSKVDSVPQADFSGIVVTYNEGSRLRACLDSLAFCNYRTVIDLGSTDRSVEIAVQSGQNLLD